MTSDSSKLAFIAHFALLDIISAFGSWGTFDLFPSQMVDYRNSVRQDLTLYIIMHYLQLFLTFF
jgi:hypothetical protein